MAHHTVIISTAFSSIFTVKLLTLGEGTARMMFSCQSHDTPTVTQYYMLLVESIITYSISIQNFKNIS